MDKNVAVSLHSPHFPTASDVVEKSAQELLSVDYFDADALRRIKACVIACEGISTIELEGGVIEEMRRTLFRVVPLLEEAQRIKNQGVQPKAAAS